VNRMATFKGGRQAENAGGGRAGLAREANRVRPGDPDLGGAGRPRGKSGLRGTLKKNGEENEVFGELGEGGCGAGRRGGAPG